MKLEIGPTQRDYSPAKEYVAATEQLQGPAEDRPRRQPRELHRRPAVSRRGDRLQGRPAGRRQDHVGQGLRLAAGTERGRASTTPTGTAASSSRSTTRARPRRSSCPTASRRNISTATMATCSGARSARTPSACRWTRPSTRAASCCSPTATRRRMRRATRRRTTTPGSTCRRCAACGGSRARSAPTPSPAPTSRSTTSAASPGSSRSTNGSVWASAR